MKKIVFLDIDGVLNSQLWAIARAANTTVDSSKSEDDIDDNSITYLNSIIRQTGAEVVVTSTWRLNRTIQELQDILNRHGFVGKVLDKTLDLRYEVDGPHSECILRGNEILCWVKDNKDIIGRNYHDFRNYVILDDDSDMLYWQRNNLILVDAYCGLTPNMAYKAIRILNQ